MASVGLVLASLFSGNEAQRRELADLDRESNPEIFWRQLVGFASRLEANGHVADAAKVYAVILQNADAMTGSEKEFFREAELRLEAMQGKGSFGNRAEFLLRQMASDACDLKSIVPMLAGSMASSLIRGATLGRLIANASSAWYTRGIGARWVAAALAFSAEAAGFVAASRALQALENGADTTRILGAEWAATSLTLGAMKLFSWGSNRGLLALGGGLESGLAGSIFPHVATFSGLLAAQRAEEFLGLRSKSDGVGVLSALTTMVNLKVGAALGQGLLGNRFLAFQEELEARVRLAQVPPASAGRPRGFDKVTYMGLALSALGSPSLKDPLRAATEAPFDLKGVTEPMRMESDSVSSLVNHGKLGAFFRRTVAGVSVYSPMLGGEAIPQTSKGTLILTSGAGSNHTSFGEIPHQLARRGWSVHCVVYPGYENPSDISSLRGGGPKAGRLADKWEHSIRSALYDLILEHSGGPLFLGGFSMGASGTLLTYSQLPPEMKDVVSGLILAAPAVNVKAFSSPSRLRNWTMRNLVLPSLSLLGLEFRKDKKGIESDLRDEVEVAMLVPRAANHGSVLLIEKAKDATEMLAGDSSLPQVLVVHSGKGDPTADESSVAFIKEVFGSQLKAEVLLPDEEGHYVLVGKHRNLAQQAILKFLGEGE